MQVVEALVGDHGASLSQLMAPPNSLKRLLVPLTSTGQAGMVKVPKTEVRCIADKLQVTSYKPPVPLATYGKVGFCKGSGPGVSGAMPHGSPTWNFESTNYMC